MLKIENYKKLKGLKFGEWTCGIAEQHHPVYRFSFHKGDYNQSYTVGRWTKTFWIEVERNVFTDADGDRVVSLHFPNQKLITRMSLRYMKDLHNITSNFTEIIKKHAGQ